MKNLKVFLFSYNYEGSQYSFEIPAYSAEEARERVSRLTFAKYDGEIAHKIPAFAGASVLVRLLTWLKNRA
jgi:hypothetical protein